jgi:CRISPR-associated protein Cmr6
MGYLPPLNGREQLTATLNPPRAPAHPGLVFDRFLAIWNVAGTELEKPLARPRPGDAPRSRPLDLKSFVQYFNDGALKDRGPLLADAHARLDRLLAAEKAAGRAATEQRLFRVDWRLTTGLGAEHPLENGFAFDYAIGVPYLSGSSVKGLCRAWAELEGTPAAEINRLFGQAPEGRHGGTRGEVVVLPAYPTRWPRIAIDIVNCHHPDYYRHEGGQRSPPVDDESPVPVFFLAVDQGVEFTFRMFARSAASGSDGATERLARYMDCLAKGLSLLGIGAKSAVGYGTMSVPPANRTSTTATPTRPPAANRPPAPRRG